MTNISLYIIVIVVFLVSIICTGIFECSEKQNVDKKIGRYIWNTIKMGTCKVLSTLCIAILTAVLSAALLSLFIKPEPQNVMPTFYYDGTYAEYNTSEKTPEILEMILEESENRITTDSESAYFDIAYAYFSSGNYDFAVEALKECYKMNSCWEYAYNIGVSYGYMMDYQMAVKYLNNALELEPPVYDRAIILETISMLENYFCSWVSSLFQ